MLDLIKSSPQSRVRISAHELSYQNFLGENYLMKELPSDTSNAALLIPPDDNNWRVSQSISPACLNTESPLICHLGPTPCI